MDQSDEFMLALVAWRENRGGGQPGMQSVINVIINRATKQGTSPYSEAVKKLQFSSITAPGDPQLTNWPAKNDPQWMVAQQLASGAGGVLADLTEGATLYYAPKAIPSTRTMGLPDGTIVPFPAGWNQASVQFTRKIADQVFFREV